MAATGANSTSPGPSPAVSAEASGPPAATTRGGGRPAAATSGGGRPAAATSGGGRPAALAGWLLASILLHVVAVVPLLTTVVTAGSSDPSAPLASELAANPPETPEVPEVPLGLDVDRPARATWVGYDEWQEHLAELSEVEQAAFRATDAARPGNPGATIAPPPAADTEAETVDPAEPVESAATPAFDAAEGFSRMLATIARASPLDAPDAGTLAGPAPLPTPNPSAAPTETEPDPDTPPRPPAPETVTPADAPRRPPTPIRPTSTPTDRPTRPDDPTPPAETPGDGGADAPTPADGDPSDRESPATSTLDVPLDRVRLGKPLAGGGLELKPVAPRFTTLIELLVLPGNPVAELRIDREGKPTEVELVKSSGDTRVDEAVRSAFFRWRASGTPLEDLGPDDRVTIQVRMILNPYAKD